MTKMAVSERLRRAWLGAGAAAALLFGAAAPATAQPVLVELYTSQGCYLCPAADKFLGELAERPDVIGLSLNVDYWDYIGWEDTLALPENKARQTAYANAHNESAIGTPHIIVHGMKAMPGGKRAAITASVNSEAAAAAAVSVAIDRTADGVTVTLSPAAGAVGGGAKVMIAPYRQAVTQAINAGENAGETLTYHNAVMSLSPLGAYRGEATTLSASLPAEADGVAVWVQQDTRDGPVGEILGAAKAEW